MGMQAPAVPLQPGWCRLVSHPLQAYLALDGGIRVHFPHLGRQRV